MSRYNAEGMADRTTYKATITIAIRTEDLTSGNGP
jgi:hypothetical protein